MCLILSQSNIFVCAVTKPFKKTQSLGWWDFKASPPQTKTKTLLVLSNNLAMQAIFMGRVQLHVGLLNTCL